MDKQNRKRVGRRDFLDALGEDPTHAMVRMVRRTGLHERFRECAADVTIEELLTLMWPKATKGDMQKMLRWVQMREAQGVLREHQFRGDVNDLRKIFDLLDENGDGGLSVIELERSGILTKEEIVELMGGDRLDNKLSFQDFLAIAQPHLKKTYVSPETRSRVEREEMDAAAEDWQMQFRGKLGGK